MCFLLQSLPSEKDDSDIMEIFEEEMNINGTLRTLEMESYSQFTDQFVLAASARLNAISKRGSNVTDYKHLARKVSFTQISSALFLHLGYNG